jgi:hypothetical protein
MQSHNRHSASLGVTRSPRIISGQSLPKIPSGLTATLISGGVKWDYTDNSGGTAQTELWMRNDSDAYTTVTYTINAGTVTKSETAAPVDLRYCKARSKVGTNFSAFTAEVSIAMLSADLILGDGAFSNPALWTYNDPRYTIAAGILTWANLDLLATYCICNRAISILTTDKLQINFDVVSGTASFRLIKQTGQAINGVGFHTYAVGSNVITFNPTLDGTGIGVEGNLTDVWSIDNFVVKKILFP